MTISTEATTKAVDYLMGVPIDVHLDWTGIRAESVYE